MQNITNFKSLWQSTFDDSQEFVDFYFDKIFSEKRNIFIEENGKIISCLQAIPFPMKIEAKVVPTCYLSGILTDKNFQKRGFMRQLLQKTHSQLYSNGVWATTLIPSDKYLFEIYKKFGYEAIFKIDFEKYFFDNKLQNTDYQIVELQKNERKIAYEYFNKKSFEREISLLATENYFEIICDLIELEQKKIFTAKYSENIVGIVFASEKGEILELFADNEDIRKFLLNKILQEFDLQEVTFQFFAQKQDFGMLRIINVEKFLNLFAQINFEKEFEFNIFDNEISENSGFYTLKNGFCEKQSINNQPITTINHLTKIIFENKISATTYMMNK